LSPKSAPLYLELRPSRIFALVLLVIHLGAVGCLLMVPLPWPVRVVAAGTVLFSFRYTLFRRALLRHDKSVTALLWDDLGEWKLFFSSGEEAARLEPDTFVSSWLVVLNFSAASATGRHSVVIFPDSLDRESFRRLRVRLWLDGREEPE